MEKEKKQKIRCICFLLASICFFIVSIVNFMDKNTTTAIPYLLLGISFLLLSITNLRKINKHKIQLCAQLRVCSQAGGIPVYPRFSQPDNSESWDDAGNGI